MMDPNQVINAQALAIVPAKRKRGRPRKYPALDDPDSYLGDQSPSNGGDNYHVPPRFRGSNGSKSRQVNSSEGLRDGMTGQAVSGFLEAEFDGGYLLTVKVRNSDTVLRGVVFKPGHFVPVSVENDVAPNVSMIKRNEVPLQSENHRRAYGGSHSRARERNGVAFHSASPSASSLVLKNKLISPAPLQAVSSAPLRGNVVPVVLQPVASSNNGASTPDQGVSVGNKDSQHLSSPTSNDTQPVALQVVHPVVQSTSPAKQVPKTGENGPRDEPSQEDLYEVETKPIILLPAMPLETLVCEVLKRTPTPAPADNPENSLPVGRSSTTLEDGVGIREHSSPMLTEPYQPVQSNPMNLSLSVPKPLESERTGKMTELLQAVQENAMKNQMPEAL